MSKTNLKTLAYNAIREKIVTCEYAPGTNLNEELLTNELNLSRTPIRDALGRLEQEGLLDIKPKCGITVKPLSANEINMIFEVRSLYEPYIILNYGQLLPKDELEKFYKIFQRKECSDEHPQNNAYFYELDFAFHSMIVNACPNPYIRQNYSMIQTQNERFRHMTGNASDTRLDDTFQEHLDITLLCLQNEWKSAADKMLHHLNESKKVSFNLVFNSMHNNPFTP